MPYTYRDYPEVLAGIATQDFAPHTNGTKERSLCGDIIAIAKPHGDIGTKQATRWLWMNLEGLDTNEMEKLNLLNEVPFNAEPGQASVRYDKRRYCIPFNRLKKFYPSFDIAKAQDPNFVYQPFVLVYEDPPYTFLKKPTVFDVHGLVFDKATGRYL